MKDRVGNTLNINDKVLYINKSYKTLNKGIIYSISKKRVRVLNTDENFIYNYDGKVYTFDLKQCTSDQVIKLP